MDSYQGGCLFPYISEVGREGFNQVHIRDQHLRCRFPLDHLFYVLYGDQHTVWAIRDKEPLLLLFLCTDACSDVHDAEFLRNLLCSC